MTTGKKMGIRPAPFLEIERPTHPPNSALFFITVLDGGSWGGGSYPPCGDVDDVRWVLGVNRTCTNNNRGSYRQRRLFVTDGL